MSSTGENLLTYLKVVGALQKAAAWPPSLNLHKERFPQPRLLEIHCENDAGTIFELAQSPNQPNLTNVRL